MAACGPEAQVVKLQGASSAETTGSLFKSVDMHHWAG